MAKNTPIILVAGMFVKIIQNSDICLMSAMSFSSCKSVIDAEPKICDFVDTVVQKVKHLFLSDDSRNLFVSLRAS